MGNSLNRFAACSLVAKTGFALMREVGIFLSNFRNCNSLHESVITTSQVSRVFKPPTLTP